MLNAENTFCVNSFRMTSEAVTSDKLPDQNLESSSSLMRLLSNFYCHLCKKKKLVSISSNFFSSNHYHISVIMTGDFSVYNLLLTLNHIRIVVLVNSLTLFTCSDE